MATTIRVSVLADECWEVAVEVPDASWLVVATELADDLRVTASFVVVAGVLTTASCVVFAGVGPDASCVAARVLASWAVEMTSALRRLCVVLSDATLYFEGGRLREKRGWLAVEKRSDQTTRPLRAMRMTIGRMYWTMRKRTMR